MLSDQALNLQFASFVESILSTFSQTIKVQTQPFNQALVLMDKQFSFVRMDSSMKYAAKKNKRLTQIATLFEQIVIQELSFLGQLQAFTKMLLDAEIFTTPFSTQTDETPQVTKGKRSSSQFNLSVKKSSNYVDMKVSNSVRI
jgi:hypothetical protein